MARPWVFVSDVVSGELTVAMPSVLVTVVEFCNPSCSACSSFPAKASTTWFPVFVHAADDDVPASVLVLRFSATFLGFVDIFLVGALTTADAALVLAYGEFDFLLARHISVNYNAHFSVRPARLKVGNEKGEACAE